MRAPRHWQRLDRFQATDRRCGNGSVRIQQSMSDGSGTYESWGEAYSPGTMAGSESLDSSAGYSLNDIGNDSMPGSLSTASDSYEITEWQGYDTWVDSSGSNSNGTSVYSSSGLESSSTDASGTDSHGPGSEIQSTMSYDDGGYDTQSSSVSWSLGTADYYYYTYGNYGTDGTASDVDGTQSSTDSAATNASGWATASDGYASVSNDVVPTYTYSFDEEETYSPITTSIVGLPAETESAYEENVEAFRPYTSRPQSSRDSRSLLISLSSGRAFFRSTARMEVYCRTSRATS